MKRVSITLVKSPIGYNKTIRRTVKALGFSKLNQSLVKDLNPALEGMINKVSFMPKVEEVK